MIGRTTNPVRARSRAGIALIEAVLSSIVVGLMFVAALRLVVSARAGEADIEARHIASHLAAELMAEIMSQPYGEQGALSALAVDAEVGRPVDRATCNNVDDYHGLRESPPKDQNGFARDHLAGWGRAVTVEYVRLADPQDPSLTDVGVKRITIKVTRNGIPKSTMTALRAAAVDR